LGTFKAAYYDLATIDVRMLGMRKNLVSLHGTTFYETKRKKYVRTKEFRVEPDKSVRIILRFLLAWSKRRREG
jgi:hypothetical protein